MPPHLASAPNVNHLWAALLVEELVRQGTTFFVVCPGSRSAPLAVAVGQNPRAEVLVHWDERAAGFVALGWGRATGRPAAVVTTSGTAVANLLPAAVEADADGVPLLLLTADRPPELRETGANQTVRQPPIFQDVAQWTLDWPVPTTDVPARWVLSTAAHAAHRAQSPPGPVHLNLPFREPLGAQPDGTDAAAYLTDLEAWTARGLGDTEGRPHASPPFTALRRPAPDHVGRSDKQRAAGVETDVTRLLGGLQAVERGVVVVGAASAGAGFEQVVDAHGIARGLGWPLLPDVRSGLRMGENDWPPLVPYADLVLGSERFRETYRPEAVLHIGGRVVSKRIGRFLREARAPLYVQLTDDVDRVDPDGLVTERYYGPVDAVLESMDWELSGSPWRKRAKPWTRPWTAASDAVGSVLAERLGTGGAISEPAVARSVCQRATAVVVAASMPVRDVEAYADAAGARVPGWTVSVPVSVVANRGASGIDGTVATAHGVARGLGGPIAALVGDLALLHDQTSLALLRSGPPVVVVCVNNDGGGIFHRLPIADGAGALEAETFERFFGTPHGLTFEHAAAQVGLAYHAPADLESFGRDLEAALESGASALIEVRTDRDEQAAFRRALEAEVFAAVDAVGPPWGPLP